MISAYWRRRLAERRSLLLGLGLAVLSAVFLWLFWHERGALVSGAVGLLGGLGRALLPDSLILQFHFPAPEPSALARSGVVLAPTQPAAPAFSQEFSPMSVVTSISEILAEAPDFISVGKDLAAVAAAVEAKDLAGILSAIEAAEPDVVKVYNDIKALGAAQATGSAAGTVEPAGQPTA